MSEQSNQDQINRFYVRNCGDGKLTVNGQELPIRAPVATQLQRIEDGQNLLLQSHAALEKRIEGLATQGTIEGRIDARWAEHGRSLAGLAQQITEFREAQGFLLMPLAEGFAGLAERLQVVERYEDRNYQLLSQILERMQELDTMSGKMGYFLQELNAIKRRLSVIEPKKRKRK